MRPQRILRFPHLAFMLWLAITLPSFAQSVRIAVAGDPSLANLVDVTTGELSQDPQLVVLDRASLDKLGQEVAIQSVLDAKDFSAIRVLPADGLVLLRSVANEGKKSVYARLVAVQPGVILREVVLPDGSDPVMQAQALAKEFSAYWPKLASIQKGKVDALSLLGLRFEVDAPETREMERTVNLLLANRLSAEPDAVVLERWRLKDAVFEKSLSAQAPAPFWTGSSLIDGSMRMKDGNIEVSLRLRPAHGNEMTITDRDVPVNLPALIERLADKIRNHPLPQQGTWNPATEAARYAALGKWALDNRLYDEGTEAIESALALGDTSRTTHMMQVKAYAMTAYPDDLRSVYPSVDNFRIAKLDPATMPQRVAAATEAARLVREYFKANADFVPGPKWDPEDPVDLSVKTLNTTLRILCAAYENDFLQNHPDDLAALRHAIQPLIADLWAKLGPAPPTMLRGALLHYRAFYAGLWNEKPEDTLALYREVLKGGPVDGAWTRDQIFPGTPQREPFLDQDDGVPRPATSAWMKLSAPWIVSWDGQSPDQVKQLWQSFVQQLAASPDLLDQCDAMKFEVCSNQTESARDAVGMRFVDFIQKHPEILSGPQRNEFCEGTQVLLGTLGQKATEQLRPGIVQFNVDLMHKHAVLTSGWVQGMTAFVYGPYSDEAATKILEALNDYEAWCKTQNPQEDGIVGAIDSLRESIYRSKPNLVPASTPSIEPLSIAQFWKPEAIDGQTSSRGQVYIDPRTLAVDGKTGWVMTVSRPGEIIGFDISTMQTAQRVSLGIDLIPQKRVSRAHRRYLEVTSDWIVAEVDSLALVYSRGNAQWTKLDVPPTSYKPRWAGGQLYLLYNAERGDQLEPGFASDPTAVGSGLVRVTLPGGTCEDLVSSRRIPPQNALDGRPLGEAIDIWTNAAGLNLSFYNQPIYTQANGKSDWTALPNSPPVMRGKLTSGGFLVEENYSGLHYGRLVLHGDGPARVLLAEEGTAEWIFPTNAAGAPLGHEMVLSCPILRGDDLCVFVMLKSEGAAAGKPWLFYFTKGQKNAVQIPLGFDYSKANDPALNQSNPVLVNFDGFNATTAGVLLPESTHHGYWLLPWADIDAARAKNPSK